MNVFFHGTKSKIKTFTIKGNGKHGSGFYFTSDFNEARYFAQHLSGNGDQEECRVYKVKLLLRRPFEAMNLSHAIEVAAFYGFKFKINSNAGGPKEHYHHLVNQMVRRGIAKKDIANELIKRAGFDCVYSEQFEHMIVFDEDQIDILSEEII
jgi:hypothetical protein